MTALEYMKKEAAKHRANYEREAARGASEEMLRNIEKKINHYETAVDALKKIDVVCAEWIPVDEQMPEIAGMPVLVVAENKYKQRHIVKAFTDYGESYPVKFLTNEKDYDLLWETAWTVTHWRPLPELPKEGKNET